MQKSQYAVDIVQQFLILEELLNVTQSVSLSESLAIELKNVSFQYSQDAPVVLKNIHLAIPEGQFIAFVGPSGSGKSTICHLIARFYDVQQEGIFIGQQPIKEMTTDSLLSHISIVFQNVYLFNDTIINNIRFGKPDATDEEGI